MANGTPEQQSQEEEKEIIPINKFEEFQRQRLDILRYTVFERLRRILKLDIINERELENRIEELSENEEIEIVMRDLRRHSINPILLTLTRQSLTERGDLSMLEEINMEDEAQEEEMERLIELQRNLIEQYDKRIEVLKQRNQIQKWTKKRKVWRTSDKETGRKAGFEEIKEEVWGVTGIDGKKYELPSQYEIFQGLTLDVLRKPQNWKNLPFW